MRALARRYPASAFLVTVFAFSWLAWLPLLLDDWGVLRSAPATLHLLGSIGPAVGAMFAAGIAHGRRGVRALAGRALQLRFPPAALAFAVGAPLLVFGAAVAGTWIGGGTAPTLGALLHLAEYPWAGPVAVLVIEVVFYGFGEEIGWRAFLLPRLAARHGILTAASLVSIPWAAWHLPLLLHNETYQGMGVLLLAGWYATLLLGCYLTAWLWRLGRKAIVPLAVFHGLLDVAMANPVLGDTGQVAGSAVAVVLGLVALRLLKRSSTREGGASAILPT